MAKTFTVEVVAPRDLAEGETFTIEIDRPVPVSKPRGQLAGLTLEEMTEEQLKRETINAKSVLYKAKQRGASDETIAANQARVDAVEAEKLKRGIGRKPVEDVDAPNLEGIMDAAPDEETASEI